MDIDRSRLILGGGCEGGFATETTDGTVGGVEIDIVTPCTWENVSCYTYFLPRQAVDPISILRNHYCSYFDRRWQVWRVGFVSHSSYLSLEVVIYPSSFTIGTYAHVLFVI